MANTPWAGNNDNKLYLQSGEFTSTLKTSYYVGAIDASPHGISWDGVNTQWVGIVTDKLFNISGQFTSTVKDSENISSIDAVPIGISSDNSGNTPWMGNEALKLYLTSGRYTSTIKDSEYTGAHDNNSQGLSYSNTGDTPWTGLNSDKAYMQSGQFTSTVKISISILTITNYVTDISINDVDYYLSSNIPDKLYRVSGQFTTTVKSSVDVTSIDNNPTALEAGDFALRTDPPPVVVTVETLTLSAAMPVLTLTGVDLIVAIAAALGISASVVAPVFTSDATIIPTTLTLAASPESVTTMVDADIFVTVPALSLSLGIEAVVVSGSVMLLEEGKPLPGMDIGLSLHAPTINITDDVRTLVTNTRNFAISEYGNFGFNSMCKFNGKYLYAKSDGIYEGGGGSDNGDKISASYKTGAVDTFATEVQRLRDAYLTFRSNGDIQLFSVGDEINARAYSVTGSPGSNIHERRVKFERGIKDRHFNFGVSNIDGSTLEVDSVKILSEPIRKRR